MSLARGMESRGYGRTRDDRRVRPGTRVLLVVSVMALTLGCYGVLANHSLVMANYISRANAAVIDLRNLLSQG